MTVNTVKSVWYNRYCDEIQLTLAKPKGGLTSEKLKEDDLELIEVLKVYSPYHLSPFSKSSRSQNSLEHNKFQCRLFRGP